MISSSIQRRLVLKAPKNPLLSHTLSLNTAYQCIFCQSRSIYNTNKTSNQSKKLSPRSSPKTKNVSAASQNEQPPPPPAPETIAPIRKSDGTLEARPLTRPIGVKYPPQAGENSEFDDRSWLEKNPQWTDLDKKLEYRKKLAGEFGKSYFQDFKDMRYHHGKSFVAPPKLFRSTAALYFPNITGRTLCSPDVVDTTALLEGRVSVVTYASSNWALEQVKSWTSALEVGNNDKASVKKNDVEGGEYKYVVPGYIEQEDDLYKLLEGNREWVPGTWQYVNLNVEENMFKSWLLRMSMGGIRKTLGKERWARYLHVRKGLSDEWKQSVGIFNQRTGYIWLVDAFCKIRWAGSGQADDTEREALVKGLRRLVEEEDNRRATSKVVDDTSPIDEKVAGV